MSIQVGHIYPNLYSRAHRLPSPELIQDPARDFSVYVLDPLESESAPARVHISSSEASSSSRQEQSQIDQQNPPGVAVSLGLMSWALLESEDVVPVTGTVIKLGTGQEALQVVFALREVRVHKSQNQLTR